MQKSFNITFPGTAVFMFLKYAPPPPPPFNEVLGNLRRVKVVSERETVSVPIILYKF